MNFRMQLTTHIICVWLLSLAISACVSGKKVETDYTVHCRHKFFNVDLTNAPEALNQISELYRLQCENEVVQIGSQLRKISYDKMYFVSGEMTELFTPEGSQTPYTLEAHERSYLNLMIASSYLRLGDFERAEIELRRVYFESLARTYNHGEDVVTTIIQASLWEKLNKADYAEPLWRRALEIAGNNSELKPFLLGRIESYDQGKKIQPLDIYGYDSFPPIEWSLNFLNDKGSYYSLQAPGGFPPLCADQNVMVVSTKDWFEKLKNRYESNYHPLLNVKSWVRLPVSAAYGLGAGVLGVGVGFGGCVLEGYLGNGSHLGGELCQMAVQAGAQVAAVGPRLIDYTLKPDLRHWESVPRAILVRKPNIENQASHSESCSESFVSRSPELVNLF